jgi:transketolase N-terminal domain/subunit
MQPYKKIILEELNGKSQEIKTQLRAFLRETLAEKELVHQAFANLFAVLYGHEMRHDPEFPQWCGRDFCLTSDPLSLPALLTALKLWQYINSNSSPEELLSQVISHARNGIFSLPGVQGISASSSSLAHLANGLALCGKSARIEYKVYYIFKHQNDPLLLDAIYTASNFDLNNLIYIGVGLEREERIQTIHRWFAMGWHIEEVDFQDINSLLHGFANISRSRKIPNLLLG